MLVRFPTIFSFLSLMLDLSSKSQNVMLMMLLLDEFRVRCGDLIIDGFHGLALSTGGSV